ncbi:RNA-binding domain-containing protein [Pedobacter borealis]|uniref:RNA-binding domain-containing protein n=1 Tax=Pedobacter borealis TaxID=475254 RepID=UPI0004930E61|nr:RNA-binding domain-containing protein [Pedobacter borealis]
MKSEYIKDALAKIEKSIAEGSFIDVERSKIELKDLSTGNDWKSLKETVCAFLNSDGGVIICGVNEKNKKYKYTGFDRNNESKVVQLSVDSFKDDHKTLVDLSDNIHFDYENFSDGEVLIIIVYPLSDDKKFVSFNDNYFERKLTQDKIIPASKLQRQREYKSDLEYTKELSFIENASITDLSIDKINKYVDLLSREIKIETLKSSLTKAKTFLIKQHFLVGEKITTLGMLVCGDDPFHFLSSRAEVNCYYDTSSDIGKDKKIFRNDVINLMEETFRYIWGNIKIGRTVRDGGKSEPEYPEQLIRETINNALAHRDYTLDNFVTVTVEPNKHIEIKNPGAFKEKIKFLNTETEIPIRRLIPGIPESKNPKLASVLKVFDKIESQGRGMASLVNACLENLVDVPFYELKDGTITLRIPSGKLVDDSIETWLEGFNFYITSKLKNVLTDEHKSVLAYFYKSEVLNKQRYFTILLSEGNNHFTVIDQLKQARLIYEHESSTEEIPIFILDRVLVKMNFFEELEEIIGTEYIQYDSIAKEILNIIYLFDKFNNKPLKASDITPEVYRKINGNKIIAKQYETLGRKIRSLCNRLESKGILNKNDKKAYSLNAKYISKNQLF